MGKEEELMKVVRHNDNNKLQKLLVPEKGFQIQRVATPSSAGIPGGRIRMQVVHVDINYQEPGTGYTPLIVAIMNGERDIAETLLFYSASVGLSDAKGNTPLHLAVFTGRLDIIYMLLRHGAKVNTQNADGNTPLHIACQSKAEDSIKIMHTLLRAESDAQKVNKKGECPLDVAAMYNRKELVSLLMDSDPSMTGNTSAIIEAALRGYTDVVKLLLDFAVSPNVIDTVRQTCALHETTRFLRIQSAEILLKYGANPEKENARKETPYTISKQLPSSKAEQFTKLFDEYKEKGQTEFPQFFKVSSRTMSDIEMKDYPLIDTSPSWTENSLEFCNECTAGNPNTNLLDGNLHTFWVIPAITQAWTVFDFHHEYTLTGITIYGWSSPQMVKTCELQIAEDIKGPWTTVKVCNCSCEGSENMKDAGVPQSFFGFCASSRFWRLNVLSNFGGKCTCFQAVSFFGTDNRVLEIFQHLDLQRYGDVVIKAGYNDYRKFLLIQEKTLSDLIAEKDDMEVIQAEMEKHRQHELKLTFLKWEQLPPERIDQEEAIPDIIVKGDLGCTEELNLEIEGGVFDGKKTTSLHSKADRLHSIAVFKDISVKNVGQYKLKVTGVQHPDVSLECPHLLEIKPKNKLTNEMEKSFQDIEAMLQGLQGL